MAYPTTQPHVTAEDVIKELSLIGISAHWPEDWEDDSVTVCVSGSMDLAKLYELAQAEWDRTRGGAS